MSQCAATILDVCRCLWPGRSRDYLASTSSLSSLALRSYSRFHCFDNTDRTRPPGVQRMNAYPKAICCAVNFVVSSPSLFFANSLHRLVETEILKPAIVVLSVIRELQELASDWDACIFLWHIGPTSCFFLEVNLTLLRTPTNNAIYSLSGA